MTHTSTPPIIRRLAVPGATLHYEVRGRGPVLAVIGSPMTASEFAPVADALAADYTVVTYDPRGLGASPIDDPAQDSTPELRADDVVAILDDLGAGPADVFGSSGGAVTGLALAAKYPDRLRTLVAHEPPVLELLPAPEVERQRAASRDIVATFHRDGPGAAMAKFMANAGFTQADGAVPTPPGPPPSPEEMARQLAGLTRFFQHELLCTTTYLPDIEALKTARVVVGIGADSEHLITHGTSMALCRQLGVEPVIFPGDHGGFIGAPEEFAAALRAALQH
ncbi:alpha/beta hydrolase [Mycobacterium sp. CBMA293]|uniref:alpha/beta fold hydrolase n=1 Tax=unclassified Mycolicibacterium TaxID=2636767 RepID=UPI0012DFDAF8|nr:MULTISPECIES: alpha/beta hydrolase [unclassified Mycolicibacterium]MUL46722.1 alpha/beta hydrolase [Mycolicibacterium sp. CBMA 360]MUL57494.1 alpha/beta hydrolase [Mycolicibacterium sp. CBMA 335]MUL70534.1 alpha/beta hydrolase [Mycolicibacterium sp. CBMA 311]MUL92582.1 alpha/beta hydrolase [Mycolicibacterium sp. CBMA 230]MUM04958.1 alpha/beta hydrolase [Mycolicibacterium sp. CBMA 213]